MGFKSIATILFRQVQGFVGGSGNCAQISVQIGSATDEPNANRKIIDLPIDMMRLVRKTVANSLSERLCVLTIDGI
jgi:hypothetical protein